MVMKQSGSGCCRPSRSCSPVRVALHCKKRAMMIPTSWVTSCTPCVLETERVSYRAEPEGDGPALARRRSLEELSEPRATLPSAGIRSVTPRCVRRSRIPARCAALCRGADLSRSPSGPRRARRVLPAYAHARTTPVARHGLRTQSPSERSSLSWRARIGTSCPSECPGPHIVGGRATFPSLWPCGARCATSLGFSDRRRPTVGRVLLIVSPLPTPGRPVRGLLWPGRSPSRFTAALLAPGRDEAMSLIGDVRPV